jgi:hypothetical protein
VSAKFKFNPPARTGANGVSTKAKKIPEEPNNVGTQSATDVAVADATTAADTAATAAGIYTSAQKSAAANAAVATNNAAVTAAATKKQQSTVATVTTGIGIVLALLKYL